MTYYRYWLETEDGLRLEWNHLTGHQALTMYKATEIRGDFKIKRYGWEEIK